MLLFSMAVLLTGAHFIVTSATSIANYVNISPVIIGILVVGLGTTILELLFSLKSVKKGDDSLAVGDLLGTVLADTTIVVGIIVLISPFSFPPKIMYLSGTCIVLASIFLLKFMKSGRVLSKREALALLIFWIVFILIEFHISIN